jgi:MFS family permease
MDAVKKPRLAAAASFIGTALEYYDYFLYGTAAALVFGPVFFPFENSAIGTLFAFSTFAVAYIVRPLGAILIGHYGDRVGRRKLLIIGIVAMGACTFLVGCLPSYASIGIAAPILLLVLRVLQGIAVGGEFGGATSLAIEHAPAHRRALYTSWVDQGSATGGLLATLAFLGFSSLPKSEFKSWGWRIPFLLSAVVVVVGLLIRLKLPESPEFAQVQQSRSLARVPILTVLSHQKAALARVILVSAITVVVSVIQVFSLSYGVSSGIPQSTMLTINLISSALTLITMPLFAYVADLIGRRPVLITGMVVATVTLFPYFGALSAASAGTALAWAIVSWSIGFAMCAGVNPVFFAEMFDTRVRYSGAGLAQQLGQVLPGFAPAIAAGILAGGGSATTVVLFVAACALVSVVTVATSPETKDVPMEDLGGLRELAVVEVDGSAPDPGGSTGATPTVDAGNPSVDLSPTGQDPGQT